MSFPKCCRSVRTSASSLVGPTSAENVLDPLARLTSVTNQNRTILYPGTAEGQHAGSGFMILRSCRIVFDEAVLRVTDGRFRATGVDLVHELRYTLSAWRGGKWTPVGRGSTTPHGDDHGEATSVADSAIGRKEPKALLMMFTVDAEAGMHRMRKPDPSRAVDELIFGDFDESEKHWGLGLHIDLLAALSDITAAFLCRASLDGAAVSADGA